ncbi:transmembrane protein, partial [Cystoisospora suis]
MHGRTKKSESALSLEEIEARRQKVKKGLKLLSHLLDQKNRGVYTPENFAATGKILDFAPEMGALWAYRREMLLHFLRQLRSEGEKDEEKEEEEKEGRSHANEEKTEEEEERNAEVHKEEEEEKDGEEKEQDGGHSVSKKRRKTNRIISSSSSSLSSSLPSSSSSRPSASSSVSCLTFLSHLHGGKDSQLDSCQKEGGADSSRDLHLLPPSPHLSFRDRAVFSLLYEELLSTRIAIAKKSSKNYCIWIHRTSCTGYLIHFLLSLSSTSPSLSSPSPASSLSSSPSPSPSSSASSLLSSSSFSLALSCILSLLREEMGSVESLLLSDSEDGRNFHAWHYSSQIASWRDAFLSLLSVVQKKSRKEEKENKEKKKKGANIDRRHLAKKGEAASQEKGEEDGEEEESEEEEKRRRDSEEEERMLQFTKRLIDKDFSNYTAWLYREQALFPSPCLAHRQVSTSSSSSLCRGCSFLRQSHKEAFEKELAWIWQGLYTEPNDQTLWRTYTSIILRFYHRQLKQRLLPSPHLVDLSSFSLPFNRKTHRHQPIDSSSLSSSPSSSSSSSLSSSCQSKDGGEESLVKETAHREETERDGVASEERKKGKEKRKMRIGWCFHFSSFCCIDTKESKCLLEVSRKDKERRERKKTTYSLAGDWKGLTSLSSRLSQGFNT